jgi:hypothetical protein
MRDRAIATHRGHLGVYLIVSNAIGNSVATAGAGVGAVTLKVGDAVSEDQSPGSRVNHVLVQSNEVFPYSARVLNLTPVIERFHVRSEV